MLSWKPGRLGFPTEQVVTGFEGVSWSGWLEPVLKVQRPSGLAVCWERECPEPAAKKCG